MALTEILPGLKFLLQFFKTESYRISEKREDALIDFTTAFIETKIYVNRLESGIRPIKEKEEELVKLWDKASISARYFFEDVHERDIIKALNWLDPEKLTNEVIKSKGIGLDQMEEKLIELLNKKP